MKPRPILEHAATRRGIAAVELAIILPLLVLIVLSMLQVNQIIQLKHRLTMAAYEGVFAVSDPDATRELVVSRVSGLLDASGVKDYQVSVLPDDQSWSRIPSETTITIQVVAPMESNLKTRNVLAATGSISATTRTNKGAIHEE